MASQPPASFMGRFSRPMFVMIITGVVTFEGLKFVKSQLIASAAAEESERS